MIEKHPLFTITIFLLCISACVFFLSFKTKSTNHSAVKGISTHSKKIAVAVTPTSTPIPSPTDTPTPTPAASTIEYTSSGFSPTTLTIKKGDTVTFKNISASGMWVASNYFPTSKLYPGTDAAKCTITPLPVMFDECTSIATGKSWSFTFNSVGRWPFHNHLKPSNGGTITVTP